jgi:hypothetical protein
MDDAEFDEILKAALDDAEEGLEKGKYKQSLKGLLALSMSDIKASVPKASYADYSKLISVVEQASAKNVAQATLVNNIKALGKKVVSIAKMVPGLASIL